MHKILQKSNLFKGLRQNEIEKVLAKTHHQIKEYEPEQVIAYSGCKCERLYLLLEGSVRGEILDENGKTLKVEDINAPDTFAEAFIFAENSEILVNVVANSRAKILIIFKDDWIGLIKSNDKILENYLGIISNRFVLVTRKMKSLSMKKIESKLANYFLRLKKANNSNRFKLNSTHQQLADYFGVTRPSLSRSISKMVRGKIISTNKKEIEILNEKKLLQLL